MCDDTTICLGCSRHGLFLPKAFVWPSLIEEADVLREEAQMVLPEYEHMVEQFAPQSADEALGEGVQCTATSDGGSPKINHPSPTSTFGNLSTSRRKARSASALVL